MAYDKIAFTTESTLHKFFEQFTQDDIQNLAGKTIYDRGLGYQQNILELTAKSTTQIKAEVEGNYDDYKVKIRLKENTVEGKCQCVYFDESGICKHLIAVMICIKKDVSKIKSNVAEVAMEIKPIDELKKLSKEALIDIILGKNTAPTAQNTMPKVPPISDEEALLLIKDIKEKIDNILGDDYLLDQPEKFELKLVKSLNKLKPVWNTNHYTKVGKLLLYLIGKIDDLQDEGYLYAYGQNWGEELYFGGKDLSEYITSYLREIPFNKKQAWLDTFHNDLELSYDGGYDFEMAQIFSEQELPDLVLWCLEKIQQEENLINPIEYYELLKDLFTTEQKEFFLSNTYTQDLLLAGFYEDLHKDNPEKVIAIMKQVLSTTQSYALTNAYLLKYLDLIQKHQKTELLEEFLKKLTTREYRLTEENIGNYITYFPTEQATIENTLKQNNPSDYLIYLSKQKRIDEALSLINQDKAHINEHVIDSFYQKNKQTIPEFAEEYFIQKINDSLAITGDYYYNIIANNLTYLKEINPKKAIETAQNIRINYKRRINLMKRISDVGL